MLLNPADPPIMMRNTVYAEAPGIGMDQAIAAVDAAVARIATYVPGYRLSTGTVATAEGLVTIFIEVEGAGDYLPRYAGNLDIMTSAAVRVAEVHAAKVAR